MRKLILDGCRGIYIPQTFFEAFDFKDWGLNKKDFEDLSSPYNEHYWDAWDELIKKAKYTDKKGTVWYLEQDDDLFAITYDTNEI